MGLRRWCLWLWCRLCFWLWCFWPITATAPRGMVTAVATVAATAAGIVIRIVATATAGLPFPTFIRATVGAGSLSLEIMPAVFLSFRIVSCPLGRWTWPAKLLTPWPLNRGEICSIIIAAESPSLSVPLSDEDPQPYGQPWHVTRVQAQALESFMPGMVVRSAGVEAFQLDTLNIICCSIFLQHILSDLWIGQHLVDAKCGAENYFIGVLVPAPIITWTVVGSVDGSNLMLISPGEIHDSLSRVRPTGHVRPLCFVPPILHAYICHPSFLLFFLIGFLPVPQVDQLLECGGGRSY